MNEVDKQAWLKDLEPLNVDNSDSSFSDFLGWLFGAFLWGALIYCAFCFPLFAIVILLAIICINICR